MTVFHFFIVLKLSHECSLPTFFSIFFFFTQTEHCFLVVVGFFCLVFLGFETEMEIK